MKPLELTEDRLMLLSDVLGYLDSWNFSLISDEAYTHAREMHDKLESLISDAWDHLESEENDPRGALSTGSVEGSVGGCK